ncbi:MAG: response regulator transcription factor [Oscillospiraceae bacterium]|nr:response regulator transcription factor [Oscillospiraceae bacterium]
MYGIFIVEDDKTIAGVLQRELRRWGYEAVCAANFQNILQEFEAAKPHLVLLDISLPFYNGYYWCGEIRRQSKVPILFLSSASDGMNMIMAMNLGGDDFVPKPFDMNVLLAKIQAILRRTYDFAVSAPTLSHKGAVLNPKDATLLFDGKTLELTKNDFRILLTLLENKGTIVSRDTLMQRLWETDSFVDENTLTVNVTRLRKKLGAMGLEDFIVTKKGVGYLVPQE